MATQQQGLFGVSPEQLMQGRADVDYERNLAAVQLTPMQQGNLMMRQGASEIGRAGAGLLGIEDPQMQAAKEAQALASQFDVSTSAGLKDLTLALQKRAQETGNQALASLIPQAAAAYQKAQLNEATVTAKMREPLPNIAKLQDYRDKLVSAYGPNDPRVKEVTAALEAEGKGKGTTIIMPGEAQNKILREKRTGKLLDLEDTALAAQDTLQTVGDFRNLVGKAFTGVGSGAKLTAGQLANALGTTVSGTSESEQLDQLFAALTTGQAKNLKGSLSDKDVKFLKEAVGSRGLTQETLKNVVNRIEREALIDAKSFDIASKYEGDYSKMNLVDVKKQAQQEVNARYDKQKRLEELRAKQAQ